MPDSVGRAGSADTPAIVTRLREAHEARVAARETVEDIGRDRLVALRDALAETTKLFTRYEDDATGTGDFQAYLSFQDDLVAFVEDLPEDLPEREVFEGWLEDFKKRQLSTSDFDRARRELGPAEALVERLDALETARVDHRKAASDAKDEIEALDDRIDHLEYVLELGDADLDAPVEDLRDPIESYNTAVSSAFHDVLRESSARDVFTLLGRGRNFPLVDIDAPPDDIAGYVDRYNIGDEPVSRLLELAGFSRSKLEHFVDEPGTFKRVVGGNRMYLDGLSAEPFMLDWPPASADVLRRQADELISLVGRFADEDAIVHLREIQQRSREDRFDALRNAAIAREELSETDRERLQSGDVESELAAARDARRHIEAALDEHG